MGDLPCISSEQGWAYSTYYTVHVHKHPGFEGPCVCEFHIIVLIDWVLCSCRFRKFDSGVLVVQSQSHSEDAIIRDTSKLVRLLYTHGCDSDGVLYDLLFHQFWRSEGCVCVHKRVNTV